MKAFLKRRWILLSCAVLLLACSVVDFRWIAYDEATPPRYFQDPLGAEPRIRRVAFRQRGLFAGSICFHYTGVAWEKEGAYRYPTAFKLHSPRFGTLPVWNLGPFPSDVSIPLWIPLAVVLGWLVIRELRWRERRTKATEAAP